MKLFKGFRKRKQKELEEVSKRYEGDVLLPKQSGDGSQLKKYIVEGCENLTKEVQELTNNRQEYRSITNYLNDIQTIEGLNSNDKERVRDAAYNILTLTDAKNSSMEITNRMPESQYQEMDKYKGEIPEAIKRLKANEKDQEIYKKDIDYLEGEKLEWTYEKNALQKEVKTLRRLSIALIVLLGILIVFFMIAKLALYKDAGIFGVIILGGVAFGEMLVLIRMLNDKTIINQSQVNYNAAVVLQNKIKLKYVNMTNAVEYAREKYHVSSGTDFEKQWQNYLDISMERERLERTNDDLDYYREVLVKVLNQHQLFDAGIWQYQVAALVDPREMVEVKHALLERRAKIRSRMEFQLEDMKDRKEDLYNLAVDNQLLTADLKGILDSIERLLNPNLRVY